MNATGNLRVKEAFGIWFLNTRTILVSVGKIRKYRIAGEGQQAPGPADA